MSGCSVAVALPAETAAQSKPISAVMPSRAHPRVSVQLEMTLGSDHNFYAGLCENVSAGGIFVATHALRPVGEHVDFSVELPNGCVVRGTGEVRWIRVYNESSDTPPGMGIQFVDLDAESRVNIDRFCAQREPLFYDD